jgi:hypothetical protein
MRYWLTSVALFLVACGSGGRLGDGGLGVCANPCVENANCEYRQACRDYCCVPGCDRDDDCPAPEVCRNDRCVLPSTGDAGGSLPRDGGVSADGGSSPRDGGTVTPQDGGGVGPADGRCNSGQTCYEVAAGEGACINASGDPFPANAPVCNASVTCPSGYTCYVRQQGDTSGQCLEDCTPSTTTDAGTSPTPDGGGVSPGDGRCDSGQTCYQVAVGEGACINASGSDPFPASAPVCSASVTCPSGYTCYVRQSGATQGNCLEDCVPGADGGTLLPADGGSSTVVQCNGTPTTCAAIGADQNSQYYGCCAGNVVYWCDDQTGTWALHSIDCASEGQTCGYEPSVESMYCTGGTTPPVDGGTMDIGPGPGPGPGPTCNNLPSMQCTLGATQCSQLTYFDPRSNDAWDDYPVNGETADNQYRSWLRRDLIMVIKYATSKVACKTASWTIAGNHLPLGLGDMSEQNGAIPGTSIGDPGHPAGTHTNGVDIDLAYYQKNTADNRLRPICPHIQNGQDAYHCVGEPIYLDVWRMALFLGFVMESPNIRVIGVDGKAGPYLQNAINQLCQSGWLTTYACQHPKMTYEVTNENRGWYYFHHHHAHISFSPPQYKMRTSQDESGFAPPGTMCLVPSCDMRALEEHYARFGLAPVSNLQPKIWLPRMRFPGFLKLPDPAMQP